MKNIVKHKVIDFCYVTDFVANGSFASLRENVSYKNSPDYAVLVRLTDFTKKWSKDFVYVSKTSYDFLKKSSLTEGDLIMSNVGEPGIVFLVPDLKQPMTLGPNSILIRPNENTSTSKFLYLYFLSGMGKKQIDDISTGAAQKKFNKTSFRELEIPLPPLPEQQRIVSILDKAFTAIAKAKANAEQNLKNANELFESYLQGVFENKGEDWEKKTLGEVCILITKGSSPKWQGIKYVDEPGVLFVTSENVGENKLLLEHRKYVEEKFNFSDKKSILKNGDVLTNIVGASIGRTAIFDLNDIANINQAVCLIRCNKDLLFNEYLMYLLNSPFTKKHLHDNEVNNARANLSLGFFRSLSIPLPKLTEQNEIVIELKAFHIETKKLEAIYLQKINDLEELKKSVLQKAFSGELKMSEPLTSTD